MKLFSMFTTAQTGRIFPMLLFPEKNFLSAENGKFQIPLSGRSIIHLFCCKPITSGIIGVNKSWKFETRTLRKL